MPERQNTHRGVDTGTSHIPQIEVMSPPRDVKPKRVPRDTGFPEPFHSGPNTTLPHPDADLSPNAVLSYEDVSEERMLKRHKLSFLKKHKRTVSHGIIHPQSEALNSIVSLSMLDFDKKNPNQMWGTSTTSLRLSRDGGDSVRSRSKKDDDDTPPTSPDVAENRAKSGIFGRFKRT
ncbi:hypothetical protein NOR_04645 [Metarhizium rileyi]|uniref:Uncharacterized protein n=1 Tax=Metarhizium rileyi (strain RCEF 4871) TaxID=1649241 RepID=A0A162JES9_METRR|nr:hypothetical protein NOR_04645 [Metarhizium rileyi RCEF 4871]TWU76924.1 hypothetical protein ED733_006938 [Metarhizium rileyi]